MTIDTSLATSSTVDALIDGYRAHVLARSLPSPVAVQFNLYGPEVAVQPEGGLDTVRHLGTILLWAHTLADITAHWRRTKDDRLHISVHGYANGGIRLCVYGGCDIGECLGLVTLDAGQSESVSLDERCTLVGLLREEQPQKGASE